MHAALQVHVEPDEHDLGRAELADEVERLKAAVPRPAENARRVEQKLVSAVDAFHFSDVGEFLALQASLRDFQAFELVRPFPVDAPPGGIDGVKDRGPGREFVGVVDAADFDALLPRTTEVESFDAGAAADDDGNAAAPVWPPAGFAKGRGSAGAASLAAAEVRAAVFAGCVTCWFELPA